MPWTDGHVVIRYAERRDLVDFAAVLSDLEVARWLWFGPSSPAKVEGYFGPIVDAQAEALAQGELAPIVEFVMHHAQTGAQMPSGYRDRINGLRAQLISQLLKLGIRQAPRIRRAGNCIKERCIRHDDSQTHVASGPI